MNIKNNGSEVCDTSKPQKIYKQYKDKILFEFLHTADLQNKSFKKGISSRCVGILPDIPVFSSPFATMIENHRKWRQSGNWQHGRMYSIAEVLQVMLGQNPEALKSQP